MEKYWKSVFHRAWGDTTTLFPFASSPLRAWVIIFVYLVAAVILTFIAGRAQLMEEVNVIISFVAALAVIFGALFSMNFIAAPARMDRDLRKESENRDKIIEKLKEEKRPKIEVGEPHIEYVGGGTEAIACLTIKNVSLQPIKSVQVKLISVFDKNDESVFDSPFPLRIFEERFSRKVTNAPYTLDFNLRPRETMKIAVVEFGKKGTGKLRLCLALNKMKSPHILTVLPVRDYPYTFDVGIYSDDGSAPVEKSYRFNPEDTEKGLIAVLRKNEKVEAVD